jgi:hypothetical protein
LELGAVSQLWILKNADSDTNFRSFEIPNWMMRAVIVLLALGFPIALIIAWAFELTLEGLRPTEVADAMRAPIPLSKNSPRKSSTESARLSWAMSRPRTATRAGRGLDFAMTQNFVASGS